MYDNPTAPGRGLRGRAPAIPSRLKWPLSAGLTLGALLVLDATLAQEQPVALGSAVLVVALAVVAIVTRRAVWTFASVSVSTATSLAFAASATRPGLSLAEAVALLLLLGVRWRRVKRPLDLLLGLLVVVAVMALCLRVSNDTYVLAFAVGTGVVAVGIVAFVRRQAQTREVTVARARLEEREKISRELHDMVAHHITGVVVAAQAAQLGDEVDMRELAQIEQAGREALTAVRRLVTALREDESPEAIPLATTADVAAIIERFRASGVVREVQSDVPLRIADPSIETTVHRIVHESLANIQHYAAGAERVRVAIIESQDYTSVLVEDSGGRSVPDPSSGTRSHVGVIGMRERIEALGGTLHAGRVGSGWRVVAVIPR